MDRKAGSEGSESRFASYVEHIASTLGHADRRTPFRSYCAGLILPGDRKSVEPIAARIEPSRVQGAHQSEATAAGDITPSEAASMSTLIGNVAKSIETVEIVARLAKLEEQLSVKGNNP